MLTVNISSNELLGDVQPKASVMINGLDDPHERLFPGRKTSGPPSSNAKYASKPPIN